MSQQPHTAFNVVKLHVYCRVLARPFPKGTVPFGGSNVPFGSAQKPIMCPLVPPQNQHIYNSHLNYLNLKTVWALNIELSEAYETKYMFSLCRLLGKEVSIPWKHARVDKIAPGTPWDKPIGDTIHLPSNDSFIHFSRHTTVFETQKVCAASWQAQKQHILFIHKPGMLSLVSSLVQFSLVFKICLPPQTYNYVASFMSPLMQCKWRGKLSVTTWAQKTTFCQHFDWML